MAASSAGTRSQSSPEAHAEDLTAEARRLQGGDAVPLSRSGVLVFAQTTQRENYRARRKPQQARGAPRPLPLKSAEPPASARA